MPPAYFLVWAWPAAIGAVSVVYGVRTIVTFYKRERRLREMLSSSYSLTQSRYLRLMVLASVDALITVPYATFVIVACVTNGVSPWVSWDDTHSDYSRVVQVPGFIWKNDHRAAWVLEVTRWRLVLAAFTFFAFFGFAEDARQHYRLAYRSIARRIGCKTSSGPPNKPSHVTPSPPDSEMIDEMINNTGGVRAPVTAVPRHGRDSAVSLSDQLSIASTPTIKPESKIGRIPSSESESTIIFLSHVEPEPQSETSQPAATPTVTHPAYLLPYTNSLDTFDLVSMYYRDGAADKV